MGDAARSVVMTYTAEFLRGMRDSLSGCLAIFHLDDQPAVVPRREQPTEARQAKTVLQARRASAAAKSAVKTEAKRESRPIAKPKSSKYLLLRCVSVNASMCMSIVFFQWLVDMLDHSGWLYYILNGLLNTTFLLLFLIIKIVSVLWFGDISKGALNYRRILRPKSENIDTNNTVSNSIADLFFGLLLEFIVLVFGVIVYSLPAGCFATVGMYFVNSQLNALYCFDYLWMTQGFMTNKRTTLIERNWPYYAGFGFLLTLASTYTGNFIIDGVIFSALYPVFIVSAYMAVIPRTEKRASLHLFEFFTAITDKLFNFGLKNAMRYLGGSNLT